MFSKVLKNGLSKAALVPCASKAQPHSMREKIFRIFLFVKIWFKVMLYEKVTVTDGKKNEIGELFFRRGRGIEYQEFKYTDSWLKNGFQIDPELPLLEGLQRASKIEFGCFSDAAPDSWGRALLKRYSQRTEKRSSLFTSEYLLGVSDDYRIGNLRFRNTDGIFLSKHPPLPACKDIKTLQSLISHFQEGEEVSDPDLLELTTYGSPLGGARPKLSIKGEDGSLWIAKFSSINDLYDNPAREAISLLLAKKCGLNVPRFRLLPQSPNGSILLVQRFDRQGSQRIPYVSAKTLLKASDGESNDYSYLDLAAEIESFSSAPIQYNLKELYKRMLFNVLIGNRDDHLRNHGFIRVNGEWQLSPVFDLEISPEKTHHALALDDKGSLICSLQTLILMSEYFRVHQKEARELIKTFCALISSWREAARELSIPKESLKKMPEAPYFKGP